MSRLERNVPLAARVAEQVRGRIAAGEFPVGTKLPTEQQLALDLGVSRNSLREGLRALVHAGMLRARPGDGTYVTAADALTPALRRRVGDERPTHVEEVRELLEREAARLAALRATAEQRIAPRASPPTPAPNTSRPTGASNTSCWRRAAIRCWSTCTRAS